MVNKKGMSAVVATVIIIGLTVAAGALIWAVVNNMIGENLEQSESCFGVLDQVKLDPDYMCYDDATNRVQFSISVGDIDIDGILVSVAYSGSSKSATLTNTSQTIENVKNYPSGGTGCTGTATPCSSLTTQSTCQAQTGCSWAGWYCNGAATTCSSITQQAPCNAHAGCSWSGGVKMPEKNSGATYFFEGITTSPTSVTIIPIISGNQCGAADTLHNLDDCSALIS